MSLYSEEVLRRSRVYSAVLDVRLFGQVLRRLNRRLHTFSSQERSQVGGVRGDEDQCEEPPDTADYTTRHRPATSTKYIPQPSHHWASSATSSLASRTVNTLP